MKSTSTHVRRWPRQRGAVLLECVLALALLIIGMVTIYAILDRAQAAARRDALTQEAREVAGSALALIECGYSSPEAMIGPSERWRECNDRERWELEIDTLPVVGAQPGTLNVVIRVYPAQNTTDKESRRATFEIGKIIRAAPIDGGAASPGGVRG